MEIELQDIALSWGGQQLFAGLSHVFPSGSKVLIQGSSGSGKSTLLRMMLGFVQPDSGAVYLDQQKLTSENVWHLRKRIAYVPQDIELGQRSVDVFFTDLFSYQANKEIVPTRSAINQLLAVFDLPDATLSKTAAQLSGGERQRIAIIAALLLQREAYLLDEPTSALDSHLQREALQQFTSLEGRTIIAVAHQTEWPGFETLDITQKKSKHG